MRNWLAMVLTVESQFEPVSAPRGKQKANGRLALIEDTIPFPRPCFACGAGPILRGSTPGSTFPSLPVVPLSLCRWVGPVRVCFLPEIFS